MLEKMKEKEKINKEKNIRHSNDSLLNLMSFKKDNNIHRENVLEEIKNGKWNLEMFELEEFNLYPGGMALVDSKKRRIIIYDDFIMGKIKIVYEDLKQEGDEIFIDCLGELWDNYSNKAQYLGEIARLRRDEEGNIFFYRYKINENDDAIKVHVSEQYSEYNQLYDIYDYLKKEIGKMKNKIKKEKGKTCLYYEM